MLDVEEEVHDVTVLDDIVLALDSEAAGSAAFGLGAVLDEVIVFDDLGADEAFLEVRVDDSRGTGGLVALVDGPGPDFGFSGGKVGTQAEQVVGGTDKTFDAGVFQAQLPEEHLTLLVTVQFGYFGLYLGGYYQHTCVLSGNSFTYAVDIGIAGCSRGFVNVADIEHRLGREQEEFVGYLFFFGTVKHHGTRGASGLQGLLIAHQHFTGLPGMLVSAGGLLLKLARRLSTVSRSLS